MDEFKRRYPADYKAYMAAKYGITEGKAVTYSADTLQQAIERKREVYRELYTASNKALLGKISGIDKPLFVSQYAPLVIVEASKQEIMTIAQSANVVAIEVCGNSIESTTREYEYPSDFTIEEAIPHIDLSNQISRANILRDSYNLSGSGVKIGILEAEGVPDVNNPYLQGASITIRPGDEGLIRGHATLVATILAGVGPDGTEHGVVPDASFYCAHLNDDITFCNSIEWMISCGVNIINSSLNYPINGGTYDNYSQWIDHIAAVHDVHFVCSAGNESIKVAPPAMAYNAITVGSFHANGSDDVAGFTMYDGSTYAEVGTCRAEKPNLVANSYMGNYTRVESADDENPDSDFNYINTPLTGTSFAAPQVAGVIAQLCCWDGNLKFRQSVVGAILAASAAEKVDAVGNGYKGDAFRTHIFNCEQLNDKEGAGILDARWAWGIVANANCWQLKLTEEDFPYEKTITINTNVNSLTRVAIFWLKDNTAVDHSSMSVNPNNPLLTDLDLYIYDAAGNLVTSSTALYSNCEIVQFIPTAPGTYTIRIVAYDSTEITECIGLAVW